MGEDALLVAVPDAVPDLQGGASAEGTGGVEAGAVGVQGAAAPVTPATAGPEIMLAAASAHASEDEKDVAFEIVNGIIPQILPDAYCAAHEIARGWSDFRRDFVRTFESVARPHPLIHGRIDASSFARLAWACAQDMMLAYARARGVPLWVQADKTLAHKVIRNWEWEHRPPEVLPAPDEVSVKIESMDGSAVSGDEFTSSGSVREGTLHEIVEDVADEKQRNTLHRQVDEMAAGVKANA